MELMAWSLSNEERAKVREDFLAMDTNHDGTISLGELRNVIVDKFHLPDAKTQRIFDALDTNHDMTIHYNDFLAAMLDTRIDLHEGLLRSTFSKFDIDDSGYITAGELREVVGGSFDGGSVDDLISEADADEDGKISYIDFVAFIRRKALDQVIDKQLEANRNSEPLDSSRKAVTGLTPRMSSGVSSAKVTIDLD